MEPPTDGSYWVEPGRLLAGRYPRWSGEVAALGAAGVTLVVDLTEPGERPPYALSPSARHVRVGIADFSAASVTTMRHVLDLIREELDARGVVYVHCLGGCGRTGSVVGCFLVERGLGGDEALSRVEELCGWPCPETEAQRALVRSWVVSRRA